MNGQGRWNGQDDFRLGSVNLNVPKPYRERFPLFVQWRYGVLSLAFLGVSDRSALQPLTFLAVCMNVQ